MTQKILPIDFIEAVIAKRRQIEDVFLSVYRDHPQSLKDDRVKFRVPVQNMRVRYDSLVQKLRKEEEIAFHSVVSTAAPAGRIKKHIPLIDFRSADRAHVELIAESLLDEYEVQRAALFKSGRSFHLYLDALFTHDAWVRFMGRLLLLNARRGPIRTDARWIGHRLMGGYGALRWSANTSPYKEFGTPRLVREW